MTQPVFQSYQQMMRETDYAQFDQEHRSGGTLGLNMFVAEQDAMEMYDPPNAEMAFTASLASSGDIEMDFNDGWRRFAFNPGDFTLQPAMQTCGFRMGQRHTILVAGVDQSRLTQLLDEVGIHDDPFGALYGAIRPMPEALRVMRQMWRVSKNGGASANLLVDGLFRTLLGQLLQASHPARAIAPPPDLGDKRLARVVEYIEAHVETPMTVGELAGIAHVSAFHFSRAFKAATGLSPHQYVTARRVERAKYLLCGDGPLSEIAFACGFASQSHFGQIFKAATGLTPRAFRHTILH
ncbi:MAG: AraC family transcriptional regulator [Pseudomonadota bacterium]